MTPATTKEARSLTLWEISDQLQDLMVQREEADCDETRAGLDELIRAYVAEQVTKVDNITRYLHHCELMAESAALEARRIAARGKMWADRGQRLKDICTAVMNALGKKRIEGRTGALSLRGNGGKAPVIITNESLVPEEFFRYQITMPGSMWWEILEVVRRAFCDTGWLPPSLNREVQKSLIEAELQKPCEECGGRGEIATMSEDGPDAMPCSRCGDPKTMQRGTGKHLVAGAHLGSRGESLIVR